MTHREKQQLIAKMRKDAQRAYDDLRHFMSQLDRYDIDESGQVPVPFLPRAILDSCMSINGNLHILRDRLREPYQPKPRTGGGVRIINGRLAPEGILA